MRTARQVFLDHLELARQEDVETDLERNYAQDVRTVLKEGVYEGHDGIRLLAARLAQELHRPRFEYKTTIVTGEVAFLVWDADAENAYVRDGVDTFLIRDGLVRVQTIHYTVEPTGDAAGPDTIPP